jgi:carboxypeptidase Q
VTLLVLSVIAAIVVSAGIVTSVDARQDSSLPVEWAIRREAQEHSQVSVPFRVLTDRFGARVTGSPALHEAAEWARHQLRAWGVERVELRPWNFGYRGWSNQMVSVRMTAPRHASLHCEAAAWTPGTSGLVRAKAYALSLPLRPTSDQLKDFLLTHKDRVRGRAVLVGRPEPPPRRLEEAQRLDENDLRVRLETRSSVSGRLAAPGVGAAAGGRTLQWPDVIEEVETFLVEAGASLKVIDAQRPAGQIPARWSRTFGESRSVTSVVMQSTDYGRLWRLLADSFDVELEAEVRNTFHDEGRIAHNVIAEIPGVERPDEVVMIGAHLDSWHVGTGATDNAAGVAIAMEALRVLARVAGPPRKTIRLALWSGEEQGMKGSRAYLATQLAHEPVRSQTQNARISVYFNLDAGAGRVRGAIVEGPQAAAARIRDAFGGTEDLGFVSVGETHGNAQQSSDSVAFSERGLTAVSLIQDPLGYATRTWHTNLDTEDAFEEQDAKDSVATLAIALYRLAASKDPLPLGMGRGSK